MCEYNKCEINARTIAETIYEYGSFIVQTQNLANTKNIYINIHIIQIKNRNFSRKIARGKERANISDSESSKYYRHKTMQSTVTIHKITIQ